MNRRWKMSLRVLAMALLAFALWSGLSGRGLAWQNVLPAHVQLAHQYNQDILPANNFYGSPCTVGYSNGVLLAVSKCGSYAAILHRTAYPQLTSAVMKQIFFGSNSPNAEQWYGAIDAGNQTIDKAFRANEVPFFSDV